MITILLAAGCFAFPPLFVRCVSRLPARDPRFLMRWARAGFGGTATASIAAVAAGGWLYAASYGASGLLALILWWWSRHRRKRSLKALGAKARARLAAMARNMPRLPPRLVPQRVPA